MKKIIMICICAFLIFAAIVGKWMSHYKNQSVKRTTQIETESKSNLKEDNSPQNADETDIGSTGVCFKSSLFPINYSQVVDGHYYYLRCSLDSKSRKYTVYQDENKKYAEFFVDEDYIINALVIYHDTIYVQTYGIVEKGNSWVSKSALGYVDKKDKKVVSILDTSDFFIPEDDEYLYCFAYENKLFFFKRTEWDEAYNRIADLFCYDLKSKKLERVSKTPANLEKAKPYLSFANGNIYYGFNENKKVFVYSFNLSTGEEKNILCYKQNKRESAKRILMDLDEKYLYCQEYLIPLKSKKRLPLFKKGVRTTTGNLLKASNKKYIFYLDKDYFLHRVSKKNHEDVIIYKRKSMSVECTDRKVYVKAYDPQMMEKEKKEKILDRYAEDEFDVSQCKGTIYGIDVSGKNEEVITSN